MMMKRVGYHQWSCCWFCGCRTSVGQGKARKNPHPPVVEVPCAHQLVYLCTCARTETEHVPMWGTRSKQRT